MHAPAVSCDPVDQPHGQPFFTRCLTSYSNRVRWGDSLAQSIRKQTQDILDALVNAPSRGV